MAIFNKFANFSLGESDIIRRYMSKKKTDKFMAYHERFIDGLVSNGADKKDAEDFWNSLVSFSKYAFNKSHACAYAITAYYTAWLKYHYPKEYLCAMMNDTKFKKIGRIIANAKECGVNVLAPDINKSDIKFASVKETKEIRYGLSNIKQVAASAEDIIKEREKLGPYASFQDFASRLSCPKDIVKNLILSGCFDEISGVTSKKVFVKRGALLDEVKEKRLNDEVSYLVAEKAVLSAFLSGNPVAEYKTIDAVDTLNGSKRKYIVVGIVTDFVKRFTKDNREMATFSFGDETGSISTVAFPDTYRESRELLQENAILVITGYCKENSKNENTEETTYQFVVNSVEKPKAKLKTITVTCENVELFRPVINEYIAKDGGIPLYVNTDGRSELIGNVTMSIVKDSRIEKHLTVT